MPSCALAVILESPDAAFKPGDVVRGFITVDVSAAVNCRALHARLVVRTHGRGNRWEQEHAAELLFQGDWAPGEQLLYPFEFVVPGGPVTYHGKLLNVSWYVYSYVDIPWGFDPEVNEEITVSAGDEPVSLGPSNGGALPDFSLALKGVPTAAIVFGGVAVMGFGLIPALFIGVIERDPTLSLIIGLFFTLVTSTIGGWLIYRGLRNRMAERLLGEVAFEASNRDVRPGETLSFSVRLAPDKPVQVTEAVLTIKAEEVVVSGSGTNQKTHRHTVFTRSVPVHRGGELTGPTQWTADVAIPADAPPSFGAPSNNLAWQAELHVNIPRWPDWKQLMPFRVHPR